MKKNIIYFIIFFSFFIGIKSVIASTLEQNLIENVYYTRSGGQSGYFNAPFYEYSINGHTTYCIDPFMRINTDEYKENGGLVNSPFSQEINEKIEEIGYFGYDYPTHKTTRYRMAAQALIWNAIDGSTVEFHTERDGKGKEIDISDEINEINALIENYHQVPSFAGSMNQVRVGMTLELTDDNNIISKFSAIDNNNVDVDIDGNLLRVTPKGNENMTSVTFVRETYTENPTTLFVGVDVQSQTMAYFGLTQKQEFIIFIESIGGTVTIEKLDRDTLSITPKGDASLIGTKYALYTSDDRLIGYITIGENSTGINTDYLPLGKYYIQEEIPGQGYLIDSTKYYFDITKENPDPHLTVYDKVLERDIEIYKMFASNKSEILTPEPNIQFDFYLKSNMNLLATGFTDDSGHLKVTLPYGTYIVKQITTTIGYEKIPDFELIVNEDTPNPLLKFISNANLNAKVKVQKVDSETHKIIPISGIKFKIKNLDTNEYVCQKTTYPTENNICIFETQNGTFMTPYELTAGHYQLEEIEDQIINGYTWNKNPLKFTIDADSDFKFTIDNDVYIELNFENDPIKGKINLQKYGEEIILENNTYTYKKIPLANIKFLLYANEDIVSGDGTIIYPKDTLINELCTLEDGTITFEDLYLGSYYLIEENNLNNYVDNNQKYIIDLKTVDQYTKVVEQNLTINNALKKGSLILSKKDGDTQKYLANIFFEIYDANNNTLIYSGYTNTKGIIELNNLYCGKFYIKEIRTRSGYVLNRNKKYFEIKNNNEKIQITLYNYRIKGNLQILKVSKNENIPLPNAYIALYNDNDTLIYKGYTNEEGMIYLTNLYYGGYYIKELMAPTGYVLNDEIIPFNIYENGLTLKISLVNDEIKGNLKIIKKDKDNNFIPNTLFKIYTIDNELIYEERTDQKGELFLENLKYGSYYITEEEAALGYLKNSEKIFFEILENEKTIEIEVINKKITGKLYLLKKDKNTNAPIPNTKIIITDINGQVIFEGLTNEKGLIIIDDIEYGDYYIKEIAPAENYILNNEIIHFQIKNNNEIVEIEMFNEKEKNVEEDFIIPNTYHNDYQKYLLILLNSSYILFIKCKYAKKKIY